MPDLLSGRLVAPDSLIPLVRQRVSGPLDYFIKQAATKAAIKFCHESQYVYMERSFSVINEGQSIEFAAGSALNRQARQNNAAKLITTTIIHSITANGELLSAGEDYHLHSVDLIRFLKPFSNVVIRGAIEPASGAELIPKELIDDYAEELADGTAVELLTQASKPWTNIEKAQLLQLNFNQAIRDAYRLRVESTPNARILNPIRKRNFF